MRDSNSIKKDEKYIPHFRGTALFTSGGGKPEGKEGEQYSPRDVHLILTPRTRRNLRAGVKRPRATKSATIKARSRGLLRACFNFEFPVVVKGAKNFAALSRRLALALHHARQNVINVPLQRGGVGV